MEELKLIERQLEVVIDGCMSEEEKKRRAKDKFGQKRKEVINMLDQTRADILKRDELQAKGQVVESKKLSAKSRIKLKQAEEIVQYLESDALATERSYGRNINELQKNHLNNKKASAEHAREMHTICKQLFDNIDDETRRELEIGLTANPLNKNASSTSSQGKGKKGKVNLDANRFVAVGGTGGGGEMDQQWQELLDESQRIEDEYLSIIEGNVQKLKELALAMGNELDKQDLLLDDIDGKVKKSQIKVDKLTERTDKAIDQAKSSNRLLYLIILIIVIAIVAFIVIRFIF